MSDKINNTLKPCPFCGFQPQNQVPRGKEDMLFSMHYYKQSCPLDGFSIVGKEGAEAWNRRAQ